MADIQNVQRLLDKFGFLKDRYKGPSVLVGYTQAYAIYVHENMTAHHPVGQAKFLEQPARQLQPVLARMIREDMQKKIKLPMALLKAGLTLQRASQKLVPVDTGALKNSAFTRLES